VFLWESIEIGLRRTTEIIPGMVVARRGKGGLDARAFQDGINCPQASGYPQRKKILSSKF
jgi:hypothetical protein